MNEQSGRRSFQPGGRGSHWGRKSGYSTGYAWWGSDPATSAGTREGPAGRRQNLISGSPMTTGTRWPRT